MDKIKRIQELTNLLNTYRHEYYNLNRPSCSDSEYDVLFNELHTLESQTGYVLSNSPTQTVGYEVVSKLQKVTHTIPLKSLDKTKSVDELIKWINNKEVLLMMKADGLTCELIYENGTLIQASTRGNGEIGEDITHNAKTFKNLPLFISCKDKIKLVGEAIILKSDFDKINAQLSEDEKYATPRNLASGSVRQLDSKICSERNVNFYAFGLLESNINFSKKSEQLEWLSQLGFTTIYNRIVNNISNIGNSIEVVREIANECSIPIDGAVISFNDISYAKSLGETSHHPLHSIAFKYEDDLSETILRDVEWRTTRTGQINPTAIFDTVIIDGTEVSRASLHNLSFIEGLDLNIGCRIQISKRNLIIPHIEDNLDRDKGILAYPKTCPSCNKETEIKNTGTADFLYCTNDNCPAKQLDKFVNFVKRDAMNIEGLSEATLEKFINMGWIKTFADIYRLNKYKLQIIKTEGFGVRSYEKLIEAIEKSKTVTMTNFLVALGINQIGTGGAKRLAKYFKNDINAFLEATKSHYNFTNIEDFGLITAYSVYEYFQNEDNMKQVNELLEYVTIKSNEENKNISGIDLSGKTFVVTGEFKNYKPRKKLEELIESLGGKLAGSVSKSTYALLTNDTTSGSKKNQDAKKFGVKIMSEEEFIGLIK